MVGGASAEHDGVSKGKVDIRDSLRAPPGEHAQRDRRSRERDVLGVGARVRRASRSRAVTRALPETSRGPRRAADPSRCRDGRRQAAHHQPARRCPHPTPATRRPAVRDATRSQRARSTSDRVPRRPLCGFEEVEIDRDPSTDDDEQGRPTQAAARGRRRAARTRSRSPAAPGPPRDPARVAYSGSGNVSQIGPGPSTGPSGTPATVVVTGRLCRSQSAPSASTAHSMSCGPPKISAQRSARRTSRRRIRRERGTSSGPGINALVRPRRRPRSDFRSAHRSPAAPGGRVPRRSGARSIRPVTGSIPNMTPPTSGSTSGCTRIAIGTSVTRDRPGASRLPAQMPRL